MNTHKPSILCFVLVGALSASVVAQPHHDDDFVVGVSSGGTLMIEGDFDENFPLPPINSGGFNGWLGDEPGLTNLDMDEPGEDFFVLPAGADIHFELVGTQPAMKVYDPFFTLMSSGDTFALGGHAFDEHPFWHIDSDDPGFVPTQVKWTVDFKVIDNGSTGFADSPVYTATFTNIPSPSTLVLLGLSGAGAMRRRRA